MNKILTNLFANLYQYTLLLQLSPFYRKGMQKSPTSSPSSGSHRPFHRQQTRPFYFTESIQCSKQTPPPCYKCIPNASGQNATNAIIQEEGYHFESNPHQQYPLHSPDITPVGVLEEHPLESNLHQENLIQESNISLDGDKVHPPVIIPTSFKTQDDVT